MSRSRSPIQANAALVAATQHKVDQFPIAMDVLKGLVLEAGHILLQENLFGKTLKEVIDAAPNKGSFIGQLFPFALNKLLVERYPTIFRPEEHLYEKDVVCIIDRSYDFEIKVSTSSENIVGNKSYASDGGYKDKSSFYLAVNFNRDTYAVDLIRFGWLDITDWSINDSANGQGSRVKTLPLRSKMITIYKKGT